MFSLLDILYSEDPQIDTTNMFTIFLLLVSLSFKIFLLCFHEIDLQLFESGKCSISVVLLYFIYR